MMNIARLSEFTPLDSQKTILHLTWQAREYLSDAEHKEDVRLGLRAHWCSEAASLLNAARTLLESDTASPAVRHRVMTAVDTVARSLAAAKAAVENGHIAARYHDALTRPKAADWDRQHAPKAISIFKRAAETGRQETHRALVELCELFPTAMPTEER